MAVTQNLTLTQVSQSIANNTSKVRMVWTSTQTGSSHNDFTRTGYWAFNGGGGEVSYTLPANQTVTIFDQTFTVYHNADGTKTVSGSTWCNTGISAGEVSLEKNLTLTTIPRASTATINQAVIGYPSTITINRASSNFTHTLSMTYNGLTTTIATKTTAAQLEWTIPTTYYAKMSSPMGTATLTCQTISGNTTIGTKETSFTLNLDAGSRPTLNPSLSQTDATIKNLTGNSTTIVKGMGSLSVTSGAAAKNGATIISQSVKCGQTIVQLSSSGTGTISTPQVQNLIFTVNDSRGLTQQQMITAKFVDYIKPTCVLEATAPTTAGDATVSIKGDYFNGSFGSSNNSLTIKYRYKTNSGSYGSWQIVSPTIKNNAYTVNVNISGLSYENTYTFQAQAADKLITVSSSEVSQTAKPVFDWSKVDFNFNVPVSVLDPTENNNPATKKYVDTATTNLATKSYARSQRPSVNGTKSAVKILMGTETMQFSNNSMGTNKTITFSTPFTSRPMVIAGQAFNSANVLVFSEDVSTTGFTLTIAPVGSKGTRDVDWIAIGV